MKQAGRNKGEYILVFLGPESMAGKKMDCSAPTFHFLSSPYYPLDATILKAPEQFLTSPSQRGWWAKKLVFYQYFALVDYPFIAFT